MESWHGLSALLDGWPRFWGLAPGWYGPAPSALGDRRRAVVLLFFALLLLQCLIVFPLGVEARSFYLDSRHGSDQWGGTETNPWKTLSPLQKLRLQPGDEILFACGPAFQGNLTINADGTPEAPILVKSYRPQQSQRTGARTFRSAATPDHVALHKDRGQSVAGSCCGQECPRSENSSKLCPKPNFSNPDYSLCFGNAIRINAAHVIVEGLSFTRCPVNPIDADIHSIGAVFLTTNANHCVVRDCEFSKTPVGVSVYGEHNLITGNWIHDNNRPIKPHWGPMGIVVCGSSNQISWNKIENYCAPSAEYGHDGGAIEINDRSLPKEEIIIDHNLSLRNQGFIEWVGRVKQDNFWIHHNVCMDYQSFLGLTGPCTNFRVENNTVVRILAHKQDDSEDVVFWNYDGPNTNINLINNIFVYDCQRVEPVFSRGEFLHSYNLFFRVDHRSIRKQANQYAYQRKYLGGGALLHTGDRMGDPRFVDFRHEDFHLRPESPAVRAGTNLNYSVSMEGSQLSGNEHPSMGAYEFNALRTTR